MLKFCLMLMDVDCYYGMVVIVCDGYLGFFGDDYFFDVMILCYGIVFLLLWFKWCFNK